MAFSQALTRTLGIALGSAGAAKEFADIYDVATPGVGVAGKALVLGSDGNVTMPAATLAVTAGVGITAGVGTVFKSSVQRLGGIVKTSILIDITGLTSSATGGDIIGVDATGAAHLGQITAARNGTILGGTVTCLEAPVTGDPDIDLYFATEATGVEDTAISDLTETAMLAAAASWTIAMIKAITAMPAANSYLYLTVGNTGVAGVYTAGKFLIELYGYDA